MIGEKEPQRGQRGSSPRLKKIIKRTEDLLIISKSEKENGEKASD